MEQGVGRREHGGQGRARAEVDSTLVRELAGSADWARTCSSFDVPVGKAAISHHFAVLRAAGLVESRDEGPRRVNRLRRGEFDHRFPGLLALAVRPEEPLPQS
ncbi:ArsR/SmtB family transcription factor [Streptomyces sp. NPDC055103]